MLSARNKNFVLVVDAGHGGHDGGAPGSFSQEKDINLSIALEFGHLVETNCPDVKVIYTRKTDVFISLYERADIANKAKADLFVSIHTNALPGGAIARGVETYTNGIGQSKANLAVAKRENDVVLLEDNYMQHYNFNPLSAESNIMLEVMQEKYMSRSVSFAQMVQKQLSSTGGRPDKGVHQTSLAVCRCSFMPSALIEVGFITTPDEERFLNSNSGVALTARCIYNAFAQYKQQQTGHAEPILDVPQTAFASQVTDEKENADSKVDERQKAKEKDTTTDKEKPVVKNRQEITRQRRETAKSDTTRPLFKIQFLTSPTPLSKNSKRFGSFTDNSSYKEGGVYKYTYGSTKDYNEIRRQLKEIRKEFADAFIIAFIDGERTDLQNAIRTWRSNNK